MLLLAKTHIKRAFIEGMCIALTGNKVFKQARARGGAGVLHDKAEFLGRISVPPDSHVFPQANPDMKVDTDVHV